MRRHELDGALDAVSGGAGWYTPAVSGHVSSPRGPADATAPMQIYAPPRRDVTSSPGLVLLYASNYEELCPAYPLAGPEVVLGRDPGAGILLPGTAASRQHARIQRRGGCWVLTDLGGRNGTLVDGELVREVVLQHLQEIRLGDAIFKFVERDAEQYAHHRIDGAYLEDPASWEASQRLAAGSIVGGYQIQRLAAGLREIARSDLSVLIGGESGTGKEVFAQQLHAWSGRRGPFQTVNCAAIPATLIEGELFGHRRGAFSGADRDRPGLLRAAHGGTLFLDEIGDMPLEAQAKLLRVIQSKEVVPLGATQPERVDVRVACATHRDLEALQERGAFRGDLFARLNEYRLTLPTLRERKEDLLQLCMALAARHGVPEVRPTFPFMTALLHHDFPYNVRELEALIKRWAAIGRGPALDVQDLTEPIKERMRTYGAAGPAYSRAAPPSPSFSPAPAEPPRPAGDLGPEVAADPPAEGALEEGPPDGEEQAAAPAPLPRRTSPAEADLRELLARHRGNVAEVARQLGRDRAQVHRWMTRYGIKLEEYR